MPAYNFKKQFAHAVEIGDKNQTVRPKRKRPTVVGDDLYLYTGMRTKQCRKLRDTTCWLVQDIEIGVGGIVLDGWVMLIESPAADDFAEDDGFLDSRDMIEWFDITYDLPFKGEVIYWPEPERSTK